ncbi:MAG: cobaltochelatase subunit CobN [Desulfobacter sp.]|nr:cobaltochelatase subunit CobN [Desulfobacter sp.]
MKDKYHLSIKQFFEKASPWAFQSITARMLETSRKGHWKPDAKVLETLAAEYAKSVITKGIACCDHTCNNPLLNQMVVSIISIPGVLNPKLVDQFKLAVEKMAQKPLEQQVSGRKKLIEKLAAPDPQKMDVKKPPALDPAKTESCENSNAPEKVNKTIEGFKMEKIKTQDNTTQMTSSGIEWMAVFFVIGVIGLLSLGARKKG